MTSSKFAIMAIAAAALAGSLAAPGADFIDGQKLPPPKKATGARAIQRNAKRNKRKKKP